jgi:hypothetical protein
MNTAEREAPIAGQRLPDVPCAETRATAWEPAYRGGGAVALTVALWYVIQITGHHRRPLCFEDGR